MQVSKPAGKPAKSAEKPFVIGFLTATEWDDFVVGGYLLLNAAARPLEFHCTAPVRPTRAQEILYGPTLRPYLIGEQVGATLLAKGNLNPALVVTDVEAMLAARPLQKAPFALLAELPEPDAGHVQLGSFKAHVARGFEQDSDQLLRQWSQLPENMDLREPFQRIQEAIGETQKTRKSA